MGTRILNTMVLLALVGSIITTDAAETPHGNQLSLSTLKERALAFLQLSSGKAGAEESAATSLVDGTTPDTHTITQVGNDGAAKANVA